MAKLKDTSEEEFQEIVGVAQIPKPTGEIHKAASDLNGREIEEISGIDGENEKRAGV